ncbi:MAG: hypothetical protein KA152_14495, partial [Verrucomicrobiales bacterium]|nr:hypothetical protein [Verrucomicrobiales bacterium]
PAPVPAGSIGGISPTVGGVPLTESDKVRLQLEEKDRPHGLIVGVESDFDPTVPFSERVYDILARNYLSTEHYQGEEFIRLKIAEITDGIPESVLASPVAVVTVRIIVDQEMQQEHFQQKLAVQKTELGTMEQSIRDVRNKLSEILNNYSTRLGLGTLAGGSLEMQIESLRKNQSLFEAALKSAKFIDTPVTVVLELLDDGMEEMRRRSEIAQSAIKETQQKLTNSQDIIDSNKKLLADLQNQPNTPQTAPDMTIHTDGNQTTVRPKFTVVISADGTSTTYIDGKPQGAH